MQTNRAASIGREDKALKVVENYGVKKHIFVPSGKTIWTVVGREGDSLVDISEIDRRKDYCSCDDFYFRVLSGTVPKCYHLIAARRAVETGKIATVEFPDEDYGLFLKLLLTDIFSHIS